MTDDEIYKIIATVGPLQAAKFGAYSSGATSDTDILAWSYGSLFQLNQSERDVNGAIVTAQITWPDGVGGTFTTDVASNSFPGAIDAWHATYASSPSKLITQPEVTRDLNGAVTSQPAITVV